MECSSQPQFVEEGVEHLQNAADFCSPLGVIQAFGRQLPDKKMVQGGPDWVPCT